MVAQATEEAGPSQVEEARTITIMSETKAHSYSVGRALCVLF